MTKAHRYVVAIDVLYDDDATQLSHPDFIASLGEALPKEWWGDGGEFTMRYIRSHPTPYSMTPNRLNDKVEELTTQLDAAEKSVRYLERQVDHIDGVESERDKYLNALQEIHQALVGTGLFGWYDDEQLADLEDDTIEALAYARDSVTYLDGIKQRLDHIRTER